MNANENTMKFNIDTDPEQKVRNILTTVQEALKEKGYNPLSQMVGYLISGDPTYITSYNGARSLINHVERDEIIEILLRNYLERK
ncbi:MAG: IreB family regulatory phosphoprotein [Clostridia bacterium]|nr:IreB family regulatory phosphoprotein [Clostridia bacterium]